jgi:hypothetical protein
MAIIIGFFLVGAAMGVWLELGSTATTVGSMSSLRLLSTRWPGKRSM